MIDKRYQRKPKQGHPWASWQPGVFSKADKQLARRPKKAAEPEPAPCFDKRGV